MQIKYYKSIINQEKQKWRSVCFCKCCTTSEIIRNCAAGENQKTCSRFPVSGECVCVFLTCMNITTMPKTITWIAWSSNQSSPARTQPRS